MHNKKLMSLIILLAFSLSGCGVTINDSSETPESNPSSETTSSRGDESTSSSEGGQGETSSESSSGSSEDISSESSSSESSSSESSESSSSEEPIPSEHMTLVAGDITYTPDPAKLNPDTQITYYMPIGGYYTGVTNPPSYVSGRVRAVFSSESTLLTQLAKWNIIVEGGGYSSTPITSGTVGVSEEVSLNDVHSAINTAPTKENARYVKVVLSIVVDSIEQFVLLNEATYSLEIYYE